MFQANSMQIAQAFVSFPSPRTMLTLKLHC